MKSTCTLNDISLILSFFILFTFTASAQLSEQKLTPSQLSNNSQFGETVAIQDNQIVVGATWDNSDQGAALVFEKGSNGSWTQIQKLTASDGNETDGFGGSIAIDGSFMLIGAHTKEPGFATGAVYAFEKQEDGSWMEVAKITASDAAPETFFGESLTLDGNRAVIGASGQGPNNAGMNGAVYVFERQENGSWQEMEKISGPNNVLYGFGRSVALEGDYLLIGAIGDQTAGANSGAAFIYERQSDGSWLEMSKLLASDGEDFDGFGEEVALSGERGLIGGFATGSAYIIERQNDGSWSETFKLTSDSQYKSMFFGRSVSLLGDRALVSDLGDSPTTPTATALVYERQEDGSWQETIEISHQGGFFGGSTALTEGLALVGASDEEAVYVYELEMLTDIEDPHDPTHSFALDVPYPNPFYEKARVGYHVPLAGKIKIAIYNTAGQLVNIVNEGFAQSGQHSLEIDASTLSEGLYFLTLETPTGVKAKEAFVKK